MPLRKENTKHFHRGLYAGQLETITLLKRNDDMDASVVTAYKVFDCRWSSIDKSGQPIAGDEATNHFRTLHIPTIELSRIGVLHINVLDQFKDKEGRTWQPETNQKIEAKLWENHVCIFCRRCDGVKVHGV